MLVTYTLTLGCQYTQQNEVKTDTRGSAVVTRMVKGYEPSVGQIDANFKGKLISMENSKVGHGDITQRSARMTILSPNNPFILNLFFTHTHVKKATAYALNMLEDRGILFIEPGEEVRITFVPCAGLFSSRGDRRRKTRISPQRFRTNIHIPAGVRRYGHWGAQPAS